MSGDYQSVGTARDGLLLSGFVLFLVGSGPLLATMAAAKLGFTRDPNPNPVLFGMMAAFSFWPSLVMMVLGLSRGGRAGPSEASDPADRPRERSTVPD